MEHEDVLEEASRGNEKEGRPGGPGERLAGWWGAVTSRFFGARDGLEMKSEKTKIAILFKEK